MPPAKSTMGGSAISAKTDLSAIRVSDSTPLHEPDDDAGGARAELVGLRKALPRLGFEFDWFDRLALAVGEDE